MQGGASGAYEYIPTNYFLAITGSDSNTGLTTNAPLLTFQAGLNKLNSGDTLTALDGTYDSAPTIGVTMKGGPYRTTVAAKNRGQVTNRWAGWEVSASNLTVDGLVFDKPTNSSHVGNCAFWVSTNSHGLWFLNNSILNNTNQQSSGANHYAVYFEQAPNANPRYYANWWDHPMNCILSNNFIWNEFSGHAFKIMGSNNIVVNNWVEKISNGDVFYLHGVSNIVRGNFVTNIMYVNGAGGYHPDLIQTFGKSGDTQCPWFDAWGMTVENNQFWDCTVAIAQMERFDSFGITGVDLEPYIVESVWGKIDGWVFKNNLFVRSGSIDGSISSIDVPTTWVNNTFIACGTNTGASAEVLSFNYLYPTNQLKGAATNTYVINNAFIGCGKTTNGGWFLQQCGAGYDNSLMNFTAYSNLVVHWDPGTSTWIKKRTTTRTQGTAPAETYLWTPADINLGTDPLLVEWTGRNFKPMLGSPLIDAGTNALTSDFELATRPLGVRSDIGCYEYDPNLLMRLDFDTSLTGKVPDVTGNEHHALQWDSTNWITTMNRNGHDVAGLFTVVGTMDNDPGQSYNLSQYAGITNVAGIEFLTNGTLSAWVLWATNSERWDTIMECSSTVPYSYVPALVTNSWGWFYGPPDLASTPVGPVFRLADDDLYYTNKVLLRWTQPRDGTTWYHMAVVFNCTENWIKGYQNGSLVMTNTMQGVPWIRVSGSPRMNVAPWTVMPWICVGAQTHDGTPIWGDDKYPNFGFRKGGMDDIRIYNRNLSDSEVSLMYGNPSVLVSLADSGGGTDPGSGPIIIYRVRQRIHP